MLTRDDIKRIVRIASVTAEVAPKRRLAPEFSCDGGRRLHAMAEAVEALVSAGIAREARLLVSQMKAIVEPGRGPAAKVIELGVERSKREG